MKKSISKAMDYEKTGDMKPGKDVAKRIAEQMNTGSILVLLYRRHERALLRLVVFLFVASWVLPEWPNILKSMFQ